MNESSDRGDPQMQRAAERYLREGLRVIPVPAGEKNPNRRNWQEERWTVEDVPRLWTNGQGIGALWGTPSDGFVDVDLDWRESRVAARYILSPTKTFGRPGAPESHRVYRTMNPIPRTKRYKVPGDGPDRSVAELLSTGAQSLLPPSIHHTGERREWEQPRPATHIDGVELEEAVADVATAALLARNWPGQGARHDYALAAAGYIGRNLPRDRAERIMEAAIAASGDEEGRGRLRDVRDTLDALAAGEPATGGPTLDALAPGVVGQLRHWHDWGSRTDPGSTREDQQPAPQGDKGLTVELAEAILAEDRFAQDAGGRLYRFEDGAYRAGGEKYIARRVKALLGAWGMLAKWSSYRAGEVTKYVAADAPELWERPPLDRINVLNGILILESRELLSHSPDWLSTVQLPVAYDPGATCPVWEKQVADTFPEDAQALAWEIPADLMQPDRSVQKAIIFIGEGSNGKSAYLENIAVGFLGRRNRSALSLHRIEADRFAASRLVGKLANVCPDLPSHDLAGTSVFKAITGGDEITGEYKYRDAFDFTPYCRLLFSANHPPRSQDASHAFFRRWLVVPFNQTFEEGEAVPRRELDARLRDPRELSGVLNKALEALPHLRQRGFTESESMRAAWEEFRQITDPLAVWLDRATVLGPEAWVTKDELLNAYNKECARDGRPYLTKKAMAQALKRLRPGVVDGQKMVNGKSSTIWKGIGLRSPEPDGGGSGYGDRSTVSTVSTVSSNCYEKAEGAGEGQEGATQKNREKPFKPFKPPNTAEPTPRGEVAAFLADPPEWLAAQLGRCREEPELLLNPTSTAIADVLYGTASRWEEVLPELEKYLRGGSPAA